MSDRVAEQTATGDTAGGGAFTLALTDEQEALRVKTHEFARDVIRPVASEYDRAQEFPWPVLEEAAQQGLYQWELYAQLSMDPPGSPCRS